MRTVFFVLERNISRTLLVKLETDVKAPIIAEIGSQKFAKIIQVGLNASLEGSGSLGQVKSVNLGVTKWTNTSTRI